jgi:3-oxoacyl-[acyl-carrier protein] reductase
MTLLKGKVALVTGAAVGIGRAIALAFGQEGARVAVNYSKSRLEAEETAALLRDAGGEPLLVQADVSEDRQVCRMVQSVLDDFGRIDILVNNAGIIATLPFDDLNALTDEVWDTQLNVNLKGTFYCCRAVVEPMRRAGAGCIINMASVAGLWPQGSSIAYGTAKAAVVHLTKCLARILGPEIRVNAIAPGFIADTRANKNRPNLEETRRRLTDAAALKRVGSAGDVAELALFLATKAPFMTGVILPIDGGRVFY